MEVYEKPKDPEEIVQEVLSAQEQMIKDCNEKLLVASKDLVSDIVEQKFNTEGNF